MIDYSESLFFYANVCHVCKASGKELTLKRCAGCRMISYCGKKHQKQHWPRHKDLCKVISEMTRTTNFSCLFETCNDPCPKTWARAKTNLMLLVGIKLRRRLEPYEEHMFKFPRICAVCHRADPTLLKDCQSCPGSSFCSDHEPEGSSHAKLCNALRICFQSDVAGTLFERKAPRHSVPFHKETAHLPNRMPDFIELYVNEDESLPMSTECRLAYNSEYLTRPTTLLHAMEQLEYPVDSDMTVHVIGANMVEVDGLELWEILLHRLPLLKSLTIVLIGPELVQGGLMPDICDRCTAEGMRLRVDIQNMLYQDYAGSQWFEKPDILVGYNTGVHECMEIESARDTWAPALRVMAGQNCPLVLTSYTLEEAREEHERLCKVLRDSPAPVHCARNPFSSLRPHRDFETGEVFYQNQFLTIYRELNLVRTLNDLGSI